MNIIQQIGRSKFFKDFSVIFVFDIIAKFFTVAIMLLLVRTLTKSDYAVFVKFNSLANLLFGIFASGVGIAFVRSVSELYSSHKVEVARRLYVLILCCIFFLLLPVFIFSFLLADLYRVSIYTIWLSLIYAMVISVLKINQFFYQGQEKFKLGGWIDVFRTGILFFLLIIVFLLYREVQFISVSLIYIISGLLIFLFSFHYIVPHSGLIWNEEIKSYGKTLLKECGWLLVYRFLLELFCQMDVFMLSRYASNSDVANYGVAQKYQSLTLSILPAILALLRVKTAQKIFSESSENRRNFTMHWIKTTFPLITIFVVIGIVLSPYFLHFLNGSKYDDSIILFQIMLIGVGISYIFSPNTPMLMSAKKFPLLSLLCCGSLLIAILGNYFLIPLIGAIAPACFFVVSHAFLNVGATISVLRCSTGKNSCDK